MPFINLNDITPFEPVPGCRLRTPHGENLMMSHIEIAEGAIIPMHQHVHEQGGIVLSGQLELSIGDETRLLESGQMYIIPPNTPHKAVAINGPAVALDIFSPIRKDYAEAMQKAAIDSKG